MGLEPAERGPGIFGMPRLDFTMYVIWVISLAIITKHTKILDKWSETDRETCDGSLEVLPQYRGCRLEQLTVFFPSWRQVHLWWSRLGCCDYKPFLHVYANRDMFDCILEKALREGAATQMRVPLAAVCFSRTS